MSAGKHAPHGVPTFAAALARDAGAILRERLGQARSIEFKGVVDLVTDADRASETLIAARIRTAYPEHGIIGEEGIATTDRDQRPEYCWIVDPLDGTTNYAHGYPHFAVSLGLVFEGAVVAGVIYDPMRDELFAAELGGGATLNGKPLHVTTAAVLLESLLATGFSYDLQERDSQLVVWDRLHRKARGIRRDGAAALNLAYVAAGRLDGFWERPLQPWDMAAGSLLVTEAGGTISSYTGGPFDPFGRAIVATNGPLQPVLLAAVNGDDLEDVS